VKQGMEDPQCENKAATLEATTVWGATSSQFSRTTLYRGVPVAVNMMSMKRITLRSSFWEIRLPVQWRCVVVSARRRSPAQRFRGYGEMYKPLRVNMSNGVHTSRGFAG
jgi:hypothetical protein